MDEAALKSAIVVSGSQSLTVNSWASMHTLTAVYVAECSKYSVRTNTAVLRIVREAEEKQLAEQRALAQKRTEEEGEKDAITPIHPKYASPDIPATGVSEGEGERSGEESAPGEKEASADSEGVHLREPVFLVEEIGEPSGDAMDKSSSYEELPPWMMDEPKEPEVPKPKLVDSDLDPEEQFPWGNEELERPDVLAATTIPETQTSDNKNSPAEPKDAKGSEDLQNEETIYKGDDTPSPTPTTSTDQRPFPGAEAEGMGQLISNGVVNWTDKGSATEDEHHLLGEGITELSFSRTLLGKRGFLPVLTVIEQSQRTLERLDLSYNELTNSAIKKLAALLSTGFPNLRTVDLRGNPFTYRSAKHLAWMCEGVAHIARMPQQFLLPPLSSRLSSGFHVMSHNILLSDYSANRSPSSTRVDAEGTAAGDAPLVTDDDVLMAVRSNFRVGHDNIIEEVVIEGCLIPDSLLHCVQKRITDAMFRRDQRKKRLKSYLQMECMMSMDPNTSNSSSQQKWQPGMELADGSEKAAQNQDSSPYPMRRGSIGELSTISSSSKGTSKMRGMDRHARGVSSDGLTAIYLEYVGQGAQSSEEDRRAQLKTGSLHCCVAKDSPLKESGDPTTPLQGESGSVTAASPNRDGRTEVLEGSGMLSDERLRTMPPCTSSLSMASPERVENIDAPGSLHQYYAHLENSHCSKTSARRETGSLRENRKDGGLGATKWRTLENGRVDFSGDDNDALHQRTEPIDEMSFRGINESMFHSGMTSGDEQDGIHHSQLHRKPPSNDEQNISVPAASMMSFDHIIKSSTRGNLQDMSLSSRPTKRGGLSTTSNPANNWNRQKRTARVIEAAVEGAESSGGNSTDVQQCLSESSRGLRGGSRKGKGKGKKTKNNSTVVSGGIGSDSTLRSLSTSAFNEMGPDSSDRARNPTLAYSSESSMLSSPPNVMRGGGGADGTDLNVCVPADYPDDDHRGGGERQRVLSVQHVNHVPCPPGRRSSHHATPVNTSFPNDTANESAQGSVATQGQGIKNGSNGAYSAQGQGLNNGPNGAYSAQGQGLNNGPNGAYSAQGQGLNNGPNGAYSAQGQGLNNGSNGAYKQGLNNGPNGAYSAQDQGVNNGSNGAFTAQSQGMKNRPNDTYMAQGLGSNYGPIAMESGQGPYKVRNVPHCMYNGDSGVYDENGQNVLPNDPETPRREGEQKGVLYHLKSGSDDVNSASMDGGNVHSDVSSSRRQNSNGFLNVANVSSLGASGALGGSEGLGLSHDSSERFISTSADPTVKSKYGVLSPRVELPMHLEGSSSSGGLCLDGNRNGYRSESTESAQRSKGRMDAECPGTAPPGQVGVRLNSAAETRRRGDGIEERPPYLSGAYPASEQIRPPHTVGPFCATLRSRGDGHIRQSNEGRVTVRDTEDEDRRKNVDNAKFSVTDIWGSSPISAKNQMYDSSNSFASERESSFFSGRRTRSIGRTSNNSQNDQHEVHNSDTVIEEQHFDEIVQPHFPDGEPCGALEDVPSKAMTSPSEKNPKSITPLYVQLLASRASVRSENKTSVESERKAPKFDLVTDCWGSFM